MSWNAYLQELKTKSNGCAIISNEGALCGKEGQWSATQAEIQRWPSYFAANSPATQSGITYNGEKLFVNRADEESIVAQKGKTVVVLQKARTVYVAAYANSEQHVVGEVSAAVAKVVGQLVQVNQ